VGPGVWRIAAPYLPDLGNSLVAYRELSIRPEETDRMSVSVEKHAILMSLQPLFQEAEEKGLWFFHKSDQAGEIWWPPEYLRLKQSEGENIWGPEHWDLRNPFRYLVGPEKLVGL
jgi:hypothetical protein